MNLDKILNILQLATQAAKEANSMTANDPNVLKGANIAGLLFGIAQQANAAHIEQTGQPIDLSLLHRIEPLE
jgi:hypothetical protein